MKPRFTDFATAAVIALPLVYALPFRKSVNDYGVYVAVGDRMWETRSLADEAFLAHTVEGMAYVNGTWLSPLIFSLWDQLGGAWLTVLLHALCVGLALWVPFLHATRGRGVSSGRAALAVALCAPLLLGNLGLRPQTLILGLWGLLHWIGSRYADRRWAPLAVVGLTALWTNTHGAFPLVIPLLGTFFVEALISRDRMKVKQTATLLFAGIGATFLTPYGAGTWAYVFDNVGISMIIGSEEFEGVSYTSWRFLRLVLAAAAVLALLLTRPRPRWSDVFVALGLAIPAFTGQRYAIWWGLALIPVLAERFATIERLRDAELELSLMTRRIFVGIFAFLAVSSVAKSRRPTPGDYFNEPVIFEASEVIRAHSPDGARLFNCAEWGALFPWNLGPEWPVFLDTRAWIYSETVWQEYTRIARAEPGWEAALTEREITVVAVDLPRFHRLADALSGDADWTPLLEAPEGVVYARR